MGGKDRELTRKEINQKFKSSILMALLMMVTFIIGCAAIGMPFAMMLVTSSVAFGLLVVATMAIKMREVARSEPKKVTE